MPEAPGQKFQALLTQLGIARVICVDDVYNDRIDIEGLLAWATIESNAHALQGILKSLKINLNKDADTVAQLRALLNDQAQRPVALALRETIDRAIAKSSPIEADRIASTDRISLNRLDDLLDGFPNVSRLAPNEWTAQKAALIADLSNTKILFIFDENLGEMTPAGSSYLKEIFDADKHNNAYLELLSYTIAIGQEHEVTRDFQRNRGVVATAITKRDLADERNPAEQLRIKLRAGVLWREAKNVRELCEAAMGAAVASSAARVLDLTPLEFDEVVFRSSHREGAHEMDTLVRVYTNAFAVSLRESLRSNQLALNDIDMLRSYRGEATSGSAGSSAWKLQRDEYYDAGQYINTCKMAPEPGDVYLITDTKGHSTEYVMVAPPCDMVVRSTGRRQESSSQALLCRINTGKPASNQLKKTFVLDYFYNEDDGWISFTDCLQVELWLLDLCSANPKGEAMRLMTSQMPTHLSEGMQGNVQDVVIPNCKRVVASIKTWRKLSRSARQSGRITGAHQIDLSGRLQLRVHLSKSREGEVLRFGIKRTQRLAPILCGEMIRAYGDYFARPARPHPLSDEIGSE